MFTRAYYTCVCARVTTEFLIFCCHKCHTSPEKGRGKSQNEALEKASFDDVENEARRLYSEYCYNVLFIRILLQNCDTCDSKNDKTPVIRAYAWGFLRIIVPLWSYCFFRLFEKKLSVVLWKVTRCFMKSDTSFCEKWHVVLWKTSRRFMRNDTSFEKEWSIDLMKWRLYWWNLRWVSLIITDKICCSP